MMKKDFIQTYLVYVYYDLLGHPIDCDTKRSNPSMCGIKKH